MLARIFQSARPYTRWWWFSSPIDAATIRYQLDWFAANGFGGVEIAWMYPQEEGVLGEIAPSKRDGPGQDHTSHPGPPQEMRNT